MTGSSSIALSRLLEHTADTVAAVRAGRSLADLLPALPAELRPGVQALAFDVLRRLGSAGAARALLAPRDPPPRVDALLVSALALLWPQERPPYAAHTLVDQAVRAARARTPAAAAFVNAVLRRFLREREQIVLQAERTPEGAWNHPAWWVARLRRDWPAQWQPLLRQAALRPPMTLRVNAQRTRAQAYLGRLAEAGIAAAALPGLPQAVMLREPRPVPQLPGFAEGEVSVQDAAAQRAAPLLLGLRAADEAAAGAAADAAAALPPRARVLDACAAPGGKTAHLLELADLELTALDVDGARLARVRDNLERLHLAATLVQGDARDPSAWWDGRPFDAVLLDAPCTASGIVRRHPDVRWLRRAADVARLATLQAALLDALWPLLAPGGRLLYATCSVFRAEGQDQIDAFLQRQGPGAVRVRPESPGHLLPLADNDRQGGADDVAVATHDGFFYALLEKT
jgi:16S rRNA (cytosine967-C5)-methyltransferase